MFRKAFYAASAAVLLVSSAPAATITYVLDLSVPGTFTLSADVSAGDNFGLASYSVPLLGTVSNLNNQSPLTVNSANFAPLGFDQFRLPAAGAATDPQVGAAANPTLRGSQNSISGPGANFVYGLGQSANSFVGQGYGTFGPAQDATSDQAWTARIRLGTGAYTSGTVAFALQDVNLTGNVWSSNDHATRATPAATLAFQTIPLGNVPEPATLSLLGLSLIGGLGIRRRR